MLMKQMKLKENWISAIIIIGCTLLLSTKADVIAQNSKDNIPLYQEEEVTQKTDWLINPTGATAKLYKDDKKNLVFSNG
jgi:hypothetical protein